jgi:hypothetical protein
MTDDVQTASGRWPNPVATTLNLGLDLVFMDPVSALRWLGSFWLVPVLAATLALTSLQRVRPGSRRLQAVLATLSAALVGPVVVLTVQDAWGPNLLGSALPQVLVLTVGSGAAGWVTWWITAGPASASAAAGHVPGEGLQ